MEQQQFFRSITTESRLFKQALFQDVEKKKNRSTIDRKHSLLF